MSPLSELYFKESFGYHWIALNDERARATCSKATAPTILLATSTTTRKVEKIDVTHFEDHAPGEDSCYRQQWIQ